MPFVQTLGTAASRRRALAALLTGVVAPLVPGIAAEADRKKGKGRGKGRGKNNHKSHGKGRSHGHSKANQQSKQPAKSGPEEAAAPDCRQAGHPCEGNQTCCDSDHVICVASGPGEATRCTPCPDGQIACANACVPACTASDQCHEAGVCDPETGACTNPKAANDTACKDGNACTRKDTCQDGVCVGGDPIECRASDACHLPGTCDSQTGLCSNPQASDGTACDDGDACTRRDVCRGGECVGLEPVECTAQDQCHAAGQCDPDTGECSNPPLPDGTSCDDGNACTTDDVCQDGECVGEGIVCPAPDQCHVAGVCDSQSGTCTNPPKPDGTSCNAGSNACTTGDSCQAGTCVAGPPVACPVCQACSGGTCQPVATDPRCATSCGPGGTCVPSCAEGGPCLAFITSSRHSGNLGGLAGADAICQQAATNAGLPGTYMAWLSDATGSPSTRFMQATGPYVRVDGTTIANNWADLTDGNLAAAITVTETEDNVSGTVVWSHTLSDGTAGSTALNVHCENWQSTDVEARGDTGFASDLFTDDSWTDLQSSGLCTISPFRLYCFQQS